MPSTEAVHTPVLAESVGGDWLARALAADFNPLASFESPATQQDGVRLLGDIRTIFTEIGVDRISSKDLAEFLCDVRDGHWLKANKGGRPTQKPGSAGNSPVSKFIRDEFEGDDVLRGYLIADFQDTFTRFLKKDGSL
jgi:hypothetical protein